ncbi:MAG: dTDP-glucose 4,6-dehydratase [Candidatus Zixiibacteriota bacterium]
MPEFSRTVIVTGGAGFIGSSLCQSLVENHSDWLIVNVDCLTYAGNLANVESIKGRPNYRFERVSITDASSISEVFSKYNPNGIFHLAAETHVDRSIESPSDFVATNVVGTHVLLEEARRASQNRPFRFLHVSTDEVYGSVAPGQSANESTAYHPNSPYAASKAASDHLVNSYHATYGLQTIVTHCSNNYGPRQFPEKLIPLAIRNAIAGIPIPIYGDGLQVRDWLAVEDHCLALELLLERGKPGESYNISTMTDTENLNLVRLVCELLDSKLGDKNRKSLVTFVKDRPGHDRRYALDSSKISSELGWRASTDLKSGLARTIDWYLANEAWLQGCLSGEYRKYYERMYGNR